MTNIFIFNNASRAAGYGIGTYVKQLSDGLSAIPDTSVSFVEMHADTKEFAMIQDEKGRNHYLIPPINGQAESESYCRCIFYYLARNIGNGWIGKFVFQFNYFQHYPLAMLLKAWFPHCIIMLTVHYMNWCFELNGNVQRMREITTNGYEPSEDKERYVLSSFTQEKSFLHLADTVLVLSKVTMNILADDYKVALGKMHLVYNGIGTQTCNGCCGHEVRTILFVGRLDKEKGLKYLVSAFVQIAEAHPDTNLVIVGDGDFQTYMAQCRKVPGRIAFLGKMEKEELEDVYKSAYMGVMPSFHEQCSYTAIEMMRHGIPIVGTSSTGLSEMLDATSELRVHIDEKDFNEEDFISQIASRMNLLLSDATFYSHASVSVRHLYEERYTVSAMTEGVQKALSATLTAATGDVSHDYLPHIDEYMIGLINKKPDIDMDFYGLGGIGVYLWWRVLQLEKEDIADTHRIALIKEHLIYYLDWVEDMVGNKPLAMELSATLVSMGIHSFFPSKVAILLKYSKISEGDDCFPSEQTILHNALKICTCKI